MNKEKISFVFAISLYLFAVIAIFFDENSFLGVTGFFAAVFISAMGSIFEEIFREKISSIIVFYLLMIFPVIAELIYLRRFVNMVGFPQGSIEQVGTSFAYVILCFLMIFITFGANAKRVVYKARVKNSDQEFQILSQYYFASAINGEQKRNKIISGFKQTDDEKIAIVPDDYNGEDIEVPRYKYSDLEITFFKYED